MRHFVSTSISDLSGPSLPCRRAGGIRRQQTFKDPLDTAIGDELVDPHEPGDILPPGVQKQTPRHVSVTRRRRRCCPALALFDQIDQVAEVLLLPLDDPLW